MCSNTECIMGREYESDGDDHDDDDDDDDDGQ